MELKIHQRKFAAARSVRKRSPKAALRVPNVLEFPLLDGGLAAAGFNPIP